MRRYLSGKCYLNIHSSCFYAFIMSSAFDFHLFQFSASVVVISKMNSSMYLCALLKLLSGSLSKFISLIHMSWRGGHTHGKCFASSSSMRHLVSRENYDQFFFCCCSGEIFVCITCHYSYIFIVSRAPLVVFDLSKITECRFSFSIIYRLSIEYFPFFSRLLVTLVSLYWFFLASTSGAGRLSLRWPQLVSGTGEFSSECQPWYMTCLTHGAPPQRGSTQTKSFKWGLRPRLHVGNLPPLSNGWKINMFQWD